MATLQKILYVEDDPDIRELVQLALELVGGFELCVCASGEDAMKRAPVFAPDLALLDVMMPGMDGPTTLTRIREHPDLRELPAVFMTAQVQPAEVARLRALGVLDVIAKPFDPMQLGTQLHDIWNARGA